MGDLPYVERDNEVQIVGQDSSGNQVNYVTADANGNMAVKDYSDGPVAAGTAALASSLIGGQYNSTLPTLTTGQQSAIQVDSSGRLLVDVSNATLAVTQSGTWTVQQGTAPWSFTGTLTNNNAAPAANNVGALTALAEGTLSASRYTTGNLVLPVVDLAGNTNIDLQYYLGAAVSNTNPIATTISDGTNVITAAISAYGTAPTGTEVMGVNAYVTNIPTVNQGTSPWITKDQSDGPVTPGTVATYSQLAGGQYNSTAPTLTTGQQASLQVNASGDLLVTQITFGALKTGSKSSIGTTAVQISSTSVVASSGVVIRSSPANSAAVYIGPSGVTANTAAATDGMPLTPGESIQLPINNLNLVYAIAAAAGQEIFWMVI